MDGLEHQESDRSFIAEGFNAAPLAMVVLGAQGKIEAATDRAGDLFGLDRDDLRGRDLSLLFVPHSDFIDCPRCGVCQGEVRQLEIQHSAGDLIPVEIQCSRFVITPSTGAGEGDRPPADRCLLILVDTRKRAHEDELRAARLAKLSLLNQVSEALHGANLTLEQILEAVLICMTAGQGLRFNRAFLLLVNEAGEALKGEVAIGPSNADEAARIWRDLADQPSDLFEMMTSYGQSVKQTDAAVNEIVRHMDIPLEREDDFLVKAMYDGQPLRVTASTDLPGVATLRGWLGCPQFAVAPLTTRRGPLGVIIADNAISGNEITDLDLEFLQLFANQSASAIENSRLYTELERRLIDLRRANEQQKSDQETLLRMERLSVMGETSAIVAHELRNPLVAIGGFARALVRNLEEGDPNHQYAGIITEEVARMESIIHDLLDFIRPQKKQRKEVVLDELVAATVARFEGELQTKNIRLEFDLNAGTGTVPCHPGEIQQVLQNYVVNAMQVMPDGGSILVRTEIIDGGIKVAVLDDGPGFALEVADQLFSPFFSTKPTGSGLGLTICSQIIKAHGGVAGARNRADSGAEFSFILPLPRD